MHPDRKGALAAEVRARREVIAEILEKLPAAVTNGTTGITKVSGDTPHAVRTERGQLLALFATRDLAQFLHDAPEHLRVMSGYIEEMEAAAFADRERRREAEAKLREVRIELLAAARIGLNSKDGIRRVQSAIASVRDASDRLGP